MSEAEAEARRASRATWACIALTGIGAVLGASVSFAFGVLAFFGVFAGWCCGFWCATAKGYPGYFGLMGPLFCAALPSLHPAYEQIRRYEAARAGRAEPDDAPS